MKHIIFWAALALNVSTIGVACQTTKPAETTKPSEAPKTVVMDAPPPQNAAPANPTDQVLGTWSIDLSATMERCIAIDAKDCSGWKDLPHEELEAKKQAVFDQFQSPEAKQMLDGKLIIGADYAESVNLFGKSQKSACERSTNADGTINLRIENPHRPDGVETLVLEVTGADSWCIVTTSPGQDVFCFKRID